MEVLSSCRSNFLFILQECALHPFTACLLHPDATGDAERGGNRSEDADGNLKDGFPSFFLHNRNFFNG